jgi:HlyD family secretion protein
VICQLDASTYEELVRQQKIVVEQARAEKLQAESTFQAAQMALRELREGLEKQTLQELEAQIALAESDKTRLVDRLAWSERMFQRGYVPKSQVVTDRQSLQTAAITLDRAKQAYDVFRRYTMPTELRTYQADIDMARNELEYQELRFQRQVERLAHFELQVEHCTIRAPHDGLVIYNNPRNKRYTIEEGLPVNEKMRLFNLPDLSQMQVEARFHESIINRVRPGQPARVQIEAMSGRLLEGHVVSIVPVPRSVQQDRMQSDEVKNYIGYIELSSIPQGLKPGMTAEVEVLTGGREDALVIPTAALTVEDGQDVCYVARPDGLVRRKIKVGESNSDLLEVTEGISEGEEVVLDPSRIDDLPALVSETPDLDVSDHPGLANVVESAPQPAN